jgi:hypothetical protein
MDVLMTSLRSLVPGDPESIVPLVDLDMLSALGRNSWIVAKTATSGRVEGDRSSCTYHRDAVYWCWFSQWMIVL